MIELWFILGFLAALVWAFTNTIDKYVISKLVKTPIVPMIIFGVVGFLVSIVIYFVRGFQPLSYIHLSLVLLSGTIYLVTTYFYFRALQIEEVSRIVPLYYISPLFILLLAFLFLGEILIPLNYLGVLLLITGVILLNYKKGNGIKFGKAFWFMMIASLAVSVNEIIKKYLLDFTDFWTILSYQFISIFVILIIISIIYNKSIREQLRRNKIKIISGISMSSISNLTGIFFITIGISFGSVTLVNTVASLQALIVFIIAIVLSIFIPNIIKEEISKNTIGIKLFSILLMIVGVIFVS